MPYDYRTVKDQYDMLHGAGVVSEPLEAWSARKNQESGTDAYNAGLEGDSYIKDLSVGLDKLLEMTGVPAVTGAIGGAVGSGLEALGLEGAAEEGAKMGRKVPRGLVNYLPMGLSVLGPGGVAAGVAGTAAMSGAETYEETGSPAASLISGGVAAAMPGVGGLARKAVLKGLGCGGGDRSSGRWRGETFAEGGDYRDRRGVAWDVGCWCADTEDCGVYPEESGPGVWRRMVPSRPLVVCWGRREILLQLSLVTSLTSLARRPHCSI